MINKRQTEMSGIERDLILPLRFIIKKYMSRLREQRWVALSQERYIWSTFWVECFWSSASWHYLAASQVRQSDLMVNPTPRASSQCPEAHRARDPWVSLSHKNYPATLPGCLTEKRFNLIPCTYAQWLIPTVMLPTLRYSDTHFTRALLLNGKWQKNALQLSIHSTYRVLICISRGYQYALSAPASPHHRCDFGRRFSHADAMEPNAMVNHHLFWFRKPFKTHLTCTWVTQEWANFLCHIDMIWRMTSLMAAR